MLHRNKPFC